MHVAALGLTCKEALLVFSQNETLALQTRVENLEALLAQHSPPISHNEIQPSALLHNIRTMFDNEHTEALRVPPVLHRGWGGDPFGHEPGSIWSNLHDEEYSKQHHSLQTVIKHVLLCALGKERGAYCTRQSHCAIETVRSALVSGYMAAGWTTFALQERQENIVWQALLGHLNAMTLNLRAC